MAAWRELARRLAHELKNPLFPLQVTVENLMRAKQKSPEMFEEVFQEGTATLLAEINNLKTIIGRFSEFSKMPQPERQPTQVNEVVRSVLRVFQAQLQEKNQIVVRIELADALPEISADPDLLHRALAKPGAQRHRRHAARRRADHSHRALGDRIEISVSDTGSGLTQEECGRLFTPYYTTKQHGTGLGLAIVQSVVSDHGGKISVESTKEKGTTFRIELPCDFSAHSGVSAVDLVLHISRGGMTVPQKAHLLIVDDEANTLASLSRAFRLEGHEAAVCDNADKALELAKSQSFDLILSDVVMPGKDGLTLLEELKAQGVPTPVVMMSGQAHIEMAVRATRLGALDFLEKPISTEKLLLTVENALKLGRLERENRDLASRLGKHEIVWKGETMRRVMAQVERVAASETRVCILGETGTGKELVARTLHEHSPRAGAPFVTLNCAAVPAELIESELFGHEKGSFTGAAGRHLGKFEQAQHGTIFLDEIGDMPLDHASQAAARAGRRRSRAHRRRARRSLWMCASSSPPTATSKRKCAMANSGRIYFTASSSSPCACLRCANAAKTFRR